MMTRKKVACVAPCRPRLCGVCGCPCPGGWMITYDGPGHEMDRTTLACDDCADEAREVIAHQEDVTP